MQEICLDANIYIGLLSPDEAHDQDLYRQTEEVYFADNVVHWAPAYLAAEVMHVLHRKLQLNKITHAELKGIQKVFLSLPIIFLYDVFFLRLTADIQNKTGLNYFDSGYLACALQKEVLLITRDKEVAQKGQKVYRNIQLI